MYPPPTPPVTSPTNHILHLLLTVFTCGLWLFVWPCVGVANILINNAKIKRYAAQYAAYQRYLWEVQGRR